jgi:hypothetical protein
MIPLAIGAIALLALVFVLFVRWWIRTWEGPDA